MSAAFQIDTPGPLTLAPDLSQRRADTKAATAAHDKLKAKLQQLGKMIALTPIQVTQASLERGGDAFRDPASNSQRAEAYELAARLEASLPDHAGTALHTRTELVMFLLDPAGCDRLTADLRLARYVLGL